MTDLNWLALAVFFGLSPLAGAVVLLAYKIRGVVTVSVTQPPIEVRPNITVQAPTALLPEDVKTILTEINEKLHPAKPTMTPEEQEAAISGIVKEARLVAEQMEANNLKLGHEVTGAEKQREAVRYITKRLEPLNIDLNYNAIALRLEAEVAGAKKEQDSHA